MDTPLPALLLSGAAQVRRADGRTVDLAPRDAVLLAWLALEGPTPRARLAGLLWPTSSDDAARNSLRQRLFQLRKQCGAELAEGNPLLALAHGFGHDLDESATLLGSLSLLDCPELDAWLLAQRERRRARVRQQIETRLEALERAGELAVALPLAQQLIELDTLSEDAHRRLMRLHYLRGDRAAALLAFDRLEQLLKHEVGTAPGRETLALLATIEGSHVVAHEPAARGVLPAAVLRPPRLIGREPELAALRDAWRSGSVAALVGEPGMGKSRLLQAFAQGQDGVVGAAGRPGDALVPYATLARLLRELLRMEPAALDERMRAELGRVLPELAIERRATARPQSMLRAVHELVEHAASVAGVLLDDLHFADDASLELLLALVAPVARPRWVLALRPPEPGSRSAAWLQTLAEGAALARVVVQPLNEARMAELVDSLALPGVSGAAFAPLLTQRTGGNPLFALETLKTAWGQGTLHSASDLPRPAGVGELIAQQLARLSADALALARVAAVAGVDFSLALAQGVLGRDALQLADAWGELEQRQVLRGAAFAHDLVHETLLSMLPEVIARHLHGRVAAWLETQGGEPARVAAHWEAAGDSERALPGLRAAADRAHQAWRDEERIAFLLRAVDIAQASARDDEAFELLNSAIEAHMNTLRQAGGFPLLERLEALARTPAQRVRAISQRAGYCGVVSDWPSAVDAAERAFALVQDLDDPALAAHVRQRLGTALAMIGRFDDALPNLQAAEAWLVAHGTPDAGAEVQGNLAAVYDNLGRVDEAREQHLRVIASSRAQGAHRHLATHLANYAVNRLNAGDVTGAHEQLALAQHLVTTFELAGSSAGFIATLQAQCARALGQHDEAIAWCGRAREILTERNPALLPFVDLQEAQGWIDLGQHARAQQALAACADASMPARALARRLLLLARVQRALGHDARLTLDAALDAAPVTGWPETRQTVRIERAMGLEPGAALVELADVVDAARRLGLRGCELAAELRSAQLATDPARAVRHGRRALLLAAEAEPLQLCRAERWLQPARALRAAGAVDEARAVADAGAQWLRETARSRVPAPFRDSFLHRNPVHVALLTMA